MLISVSIHSVLHTSSWVRYELYNKNCSSRRSMSSDRTLATALLAVCQPLRRKLHAPMPNRARQELSHLAHPQALRELRPEAWATEIMTWCMVVSTKGPAGEQLVETVAVPVQHLQDHGGRGVFAGPAGSGDALARRLPLLVRALEDTSAHLHRAVAEGAGDPLVGQPQAPPWLRYTSVRCV